MPPPGKMCLGKLENGLLRILHGGKSSFEGAWVLEIVKLQCDGEDQG